MTQPGVIDVSEPLVCVCEYRKTKTGVLHQLARNVDAVCM